MNCLCHLYRPDGANAADAEGLYLGQFSRIQNETVLFGGVIKGFELVARIGRSVEGDDDGRLDGGV